MINREKKIRNEEIEKYLCFVDARTMICEYFLASGVDSGIRGRNVAGRGVAGVGGIILGRVSHGGV
jgi:hypothetical protein